MSHNGHQLDNRRPKGRVSSLSRPLPRQRAATDGRREAVLIRLQEDITRKMYDHSIFDFTLGLNGVASVQILADFSTPFSKNMACGTAK